MRAWLSEEGPMRLCLHYVLAMLVRVPGRSKHEASSAGGIVASDNSIAER